MSERERANKVSSALAGKRNGSVERTCSFSITAPFSSFNNGLTAPAARFSRPTHRSSSNPFTPSTVSGSLFGSPSFLCGPPRSGIEFSPAT